MALFETNYYGKNVQNGCRLLDKKARGWWRKIKLARFDAQNNWTCILAQLYGKYNLGLKKLGVIDSPKYGFCSSGHNPYWRAEILKRRKRAKLRELAKV